MHIHEKFFLYSLQSEEEGGPYSGMYSGIDLTTYDSDVYTAEVNETMEDDWEADHDPLYLIGQVFDTVYFNIDRYSPAGT